MAQYDSPFEVAVARARRLAKKASSQLEFLENMVRKKDFEQAYPAGFEAVATVEKLALLTRSLPCYTGHPSARKELETTLSEEIPVEIGFTEQGWFTLRIPLLLPKKEHGSPEYIRGFLYPAMKRYFREVEPIRFDDCVLIYRHVYDRTRTDRKYRDHDNIELNAVTDLVALYVMADDGPMRCRHYYCSAAGPVERTEVYVIPQENFSTWLAMEPNIPESGLPIQNGTSFWPEKDGENRAKSTETENCDA